MFYGVDTSNRDALFSLVKELKGDLTMTNTNTTGDTNINEIITFVRPRTGKTYERVNGVWHLNGKPIPKSGKGNRAAQWQIEGEYQATLRASQSHEFWPGNADGSCTYCNRLSSSGECRPRSEERIY